MKKSTLIKLAVMGIAASGTSVEGSDISNLSGASSLLAGGSCGGKSGCGTKSAGNGASYSAPSHSCGGVPVPASGCHASTAPQGYTIHGCGAAKSDGAVNTGSAPQAAPNHYQPSAQPTTQPAAQQPSGSRNYYYEKTANTPVAPSTSDQEKMKQAATGGKQAVPTNVAPATNTNVPSNMLPNTRTNMNPVNSPSGTVGNTGTGSSSK